MSVKYLVMCKSEFDEEPCCDYAFTNIDAALTELAYLTWQNDCSYINYYIEEQPLEDGDEEYLDDTALVCMWGPGMQKTRDRLEQNGLRSSNAYYAHLKAEKENALSPDV